MNIGELARQTGVSIRSLRYYETKQLLSSQRGENGYRTYDQTAIERVRMIQFYLGLGLSTDEIFDVVFCSKPDDVASLCDENDLSSCPKERDFYQCTAPKFLYTNLTDESELLQHRGST
jgi:DNA-binding transcriptional MerR regulator